MNVARLREDEFAGSLDVGVSLGRLGEIRLGTLRSQTNYKSEIYTGQPQGGTVQTFALHLKTFLDRVDSETFPRDGWSAAAEVFQAFDSLGGDSTYGKLTARGLWAKTFGNFTLAPYASVDVRIGPNLRPITDAATLGGFLRLSGLAPGQLYADNAFLARIVAYQRLVKMNSLIGTGVYAGLSVETGQAWYSGLNFSSLRFAGSAFVSADTTLGPLYLAFGLADGGFHSFYLALGLPLN